MNRDDEIEWNESITDTVDLENFRDSLFSLYLHKYSHFTREISF